MAPTTRQIGFSAFAGFAAVAQGLKNTIMQYNNSIFSQSGAVITTEIHTAYTTYCPSPTIFVHHNITYTVTSATTLTITECPCSEANPISQPTVGAEANPPLSSGPAGNILPTPTLVSTGTPVQNGGALPKSVQATPLVPNGGMQTSAPAGYNGPPQNGVNGEKTAKFSTSTTDITHTVRGTTTETPIVMSISTPAAGSEPSGVGQGYIGGVNHSSGAMPPPTSPLGTPASTAPGPSSIIVSSTTGISSELPQFTGAASGLARAKVVWVLMAAFFVEVISLALN